MSLFSLINGMLNYILDANSKDTNEKSELNYNINLLNDVIFYKNSGNLNDLFLK